jgi:hypothetical protein
VAVRSRQIRQHVTAARPLRRSLTGLAAAAVVFGAGCARGGARPAGPGIAERGWIVGADRLGPDRLTAAAPAGDDVIVGSVRSGANGADEAGMVRQIAADGSIGWSRALPAAPRAIAVAADGSIAVALEGRADGSAVAAAGLDGLPDGLRGQPGAAVVVIDEGGAVRATIGAGATRWAMVKGLAWDGDALVIAGAFAGTLRLGDAVVTADGNADGFWARVERGAVTLRRLGGDGFDAVNGVAVLTDGRLAIAGTFTGAAELAELTLESPADDEVAGDGFVAVIARDGAIVWARTWGGDLEDTGAGVAALAGGELAIAGTISGEVEVAGRRMIAAGASDGLIAILAGDGAVRGAHLIGGADVDSITSIAAGAGGSRAIVAGRFSGSLATRAGAIAAPSADAAFVALCDRDAILAAAPLATPAATVEARVAADPRGWLVAVHAGAPLGFLADHLPAGPALLRRPW